MFSLPWVPYVNCCCRRVEVGLASTLTLLCFWAIVVMSLQPCFDLLCCGDWQGEFEADLRSTLGLVMCGLFVECDFFIVLLS